MARLWTTLAMACLLVGVRAARAEDPAGHEPGKADPAAEPKAEGTGEPKKEAGPGIHFATSYAAAMAEAKDRGCIVFATFHMDNCHWCVKQEEEVFAKAEFQTWAAENVVFLLGHKGHEHAKAPAGADSKTEGCGMYPGLSCEDHEKILADATSGEGGPKLVVNGYPSSFMIAPDGKFEQHKADRVVKDLIAGVDDFTKKNGVRPSKKYQGYLKSLEDGDKAVSQSKWKDALAQYAKVDAAMKKTPSLAPGVSTRVTTLNEKVVAEFAKLRDVEGTELPAKIASIKALRSQVGLKLVAGYMPVVADLDAWIKANPLPPPAVPAKGGTAAK